MEEITTKKLPFSVLDSHVRYQYDYLLKTLICFHVKEQDISVTPSTVSHVYFSYFYQSQMIGSQCHFGFNFPWIWI